MSGTCKAEEGDGDNGHVAKIHEHGHQFVDLQLGVEVEQTIQEQIRCTASTGEVRPPPGGWHGVSQHVNQTGESEIPSASCTEVQAS